MPLEVVFLADRTRPAWLGLVLIERLPPGAKGSRGLYDAPPSPGLLPTVIGFLGLERPPGRFVRLSVLAISINPG